MSPLARLASGLIRAYQLFLSPLLGMACRFEPSCSVYAREALATHGAFKGLKLAAGRVLRCHPWGGHGFDPVSDAPAPDHPRTHPKDGATRDFSPPPT
ncbi:MAG: membrane protein insertion efficiency factor YidD [Proteobacteria bacterium]|nr:membrane protein insertion efficiency factor YidD [Pseudomonadota bacterium]